MSLSSRLLGGIGYGCVMTSADAILSSDYPGEITKMMGIMEGFCGMGLIIGPVLGAALYISGGVFLSFMLSGVFLLVFTPMAYLLLGVPKPYLDSDNNVNGLELILKPKIALDGGVQFLVMFSFGILYPILELHLETFHLSTHFVALCFSLYMGSYTIFSVIVVLLPKRVDKRLIMSSGILLFSLSYTMLGPWNLIYPHDLSIVLAGLVLIGFSMAFMYVPSLGHMIDLAFEEYDYPKDDKIIDELSGVSNIILNAGEIIGPMVSGLVYQYLGVENGFGIIGIVILSYLIIYMIGSGLLSNKKIYKSKVGALMETIEN